jgi:hypothetical protein
MLRKNFLISSVVMLLAALLTSACQLAIAPVAPGLCVSAFEATVRQGPNAGLALAGTLLMETSASGSVNGVLKTTDDQEVKVVGQVNGYAVNLTFVAGEDTYIFGTGSGEQEIFHCEGAWGGPFAGPNPGDIGDWIGAFDSSDPEANQELITIDPNPGTIDFTCNTEACVCRGVGDCVDLVNTRLCNGELLEITFSDGSKGAGCVRN